MSFGCLVGQDTPSLIRLQLGHQDLAVLMGWLYFCTLQEHVSSKVQSRAKVYVLSCHQSIIYIGPLETITDIKLDQNPLIRTHKHDLLTILCKALFLETSALIFVPVKNEIVA